MQDSPPKRIDQILPMLQDQDYNLTRFNSRKHQSGGVCARTLQKLIVRYRKILTTRKLQINGNLLRRPSMKRFELLGERCHFLRDSIKEVS